MSKYYWMAVTSDEFELPIAVEESAVDLACALGVSSHSIYSFINEKHSGKIIGQKYVKVRRI